MVTAIAAAVAVAAVVAAAVAAVAAAVAAVVAVVITEVAAPQEVARSLNLKSAFQFQEQCSTCTIEKVSVFPLDCDRKINHLK